MNYLRFRNFHRGWNYSLVSVIFASLVMAVLVFNEVKTVPVARAATDCTNNDRCFLGRAINVANYGNVAQIGTASPFVNSGGLSTMLVQSRSGSIFIQTGWDKQDNTSGHVWALWESVNPARCPPISPPPGCEYSNGHYDPTFGSGSITGDNNYYNDYNGTYWCHGFGGTPCFKYEYPGYPDYVGMGSSPQPGTIAYYGETRFTTDQMGGANSSNAIYVLNPRYKTTTNGSFSSYVTTPGNSYASSTSRHESGGGNCGYAPCPYDYGWDFPASVLDIYIWTV